MSYCHVSSQIAKHCSNEGETFCPECGANMYIQEDDSTVVECSECKNTIDMDEGEY